MKGKIFNDPVYGFIQIPYGLIFDLVEHPWFQRLRRIKQVGLTHYVYPGALHTRFHHALGALHLMGEAIKNLRAKQVEITPEEAEAVQVAILLHDIGHGPFSHALEHTLINVHHEALSLAFMQALNEQFDNRLSLAIQIFQDQYHKPFLHQLVSGQLDMDRMDYLNRDSFYSGVSEGVIGYHRIIKMLDVADGRLVVEVKGLYSIEKFLIARRLMYWQVYLHKTSLAAEQMLIRTLRRAKKLVETGVKVSASTSLQYFLEQEFNENTFSDRRNELLEKFARLDDIDIWMAIKEWSNHPDTLLSLLADSILNRRLFKIKLKNSAFESDYVEALRHKAVQRYNVSLEEAKSLVFDGKETNNIYSASKDEIQILKKNGTVLPMSAIADHGIQPKPITKHFVCFPKALIN